jgi:hypothetical protein
MLDISATPRSKPVAPISAQQRVLPAVADSCNYVLRRRQYDRTSTRVVSE